MLTRHLFNWIAAGLALCLPLTAHAQVENQMNAFWDEIGVAANVTGPGAYEGQRAGYYTFGNVYVRAPQETLQPLSVQLPGYRAGCGGIDLYAGGFSYVNSEQLVAMMKAVANNAASFAFQVALETISPVIAEKVGELQKLAQDINNFSINSCDAAQTAVAAVWPESDQASRVICEASAARRGLYPDWVAAKHGCGSEGERTSILAGASDTEKAQAPVNVNIAWAALGNIPDLAADREYRELLMTLAGTAILTAGANDDAEQSYTYLSAKMLDAATLKVFLDGGAIELYRCDEVDLCLNPTSVTETIAADAALRPRVQAMLAEIIARVRARQPLEARHQAFLNMTTLPVYKLINVHTAYEGPFADQTIAAYADLIAVDILFTLVDRFAARLMEAGDTATSGSKSELEKWRSDMITMRELLFAHQSEIQQRVGVVEQIIARTQIMERQLAGRLSRDLADAYEFSKATSF